MTRRVQVATIGLLLAFALMAFSAAIAVRNVG